MKRNLSYVIMLCIVIISLTSCSKAGRLLRFVGKTAAKSELVVSKEAHIGGTLTANTPHVPGRIVSSEKQFIATRTMIAGGKVIRKNIDEDNRRK